MSRLLLVVLSILTAILWAYVFFTRAEQVMNGIESGDRVVTTLYPRPVVNGQWVLFLARDNTNREAFVRCMRPIRVGDTIALESVTFGYRDNVLYAARCM